MKKYFNFTVKKAVTVNNLITLEYLNLSSPFCYPEEVHEFFEFAYVDGGSLVCTADDVEHVLNQNDIFVIPPKVKHYYSVKGTKSASVFIVCFSCKSDIVELIKGKTTLDKNQKGTLSKMLSESQKAFRFPFDRKLVLLENPVFGAQQLIENLIEETLISLIRLKISNSDDIKIVSSDTELESSLVEDVLSILKANLYSSISLNDVCKKTYYSNTYLNNVFKKNVGTSIIQYYIGLKIAESKKLLKEGLTVNEISLKLCFTSPNYFSKVFKKHVGVTPSEFKESIR